MTAVADLDAARETLLAELREHSLILGEVTLASGTTAQYYVDARRALLSERCLRRPQQLGGGAGQGAIDLHLSVRRGGRGRDADEGPEEDSEAEAGHVVPGIVSSAGRLL